MVPKRLWKDFDAVFKKTSSGFFRWIHEHSGTNARLTEIQSAIGRYQLRKLDYWVKKRFENSKIIWEALKDIKSVLIPQIPNGYKHVAYRCNILLNPKHLIKGFNRDRIMNLLKKIKSNVL